MSMPAAGRPVFGVLLALSFCMTAGCQPGSKKMPAMHPVEGKVVYKTGQPMTGGVVNFQSQADQSLTTTGEIQPDGSFSLSTFADKERVKGAPLGEYRVTVVPPLGADHSVRPISIAKPYKIEAKENRFTITLDKAAPKK
jgi:hypothetical protein